MSLCGSFYRDKLQKFMTIRPFALLMLLHASTDCLAAENKVPKRPSPTCSLKTLDAPNNNAKEIAEALNGMSDGITVKSIGTTSIMICGDDTNHAVATIVEAAGKLGKENTARMSSRESHVVHLFFNRDAAGIAAILQKAFPKLSVAAAGTDTIAVGSVDGSDVETARHAKRLVSALDVPRPEVTVNAWSVQVSNKNADEVEKLSEVIRSKVSAHNRYLQEALQRAHKFLDEERKSKGKDFYDPTFYSYLTQRYVVPGTSLVDGWNPNYWHACTRGTYCLGYEDMFEPQPTISSMLLIVLAAKDPNLAAEFINNLEGERESQPNSISAKNGQSDGDKITKPKKLLTTQGYAKRDNPPLTLNDVYGIPGVSQCDEVASEAYKNHDKPLFACLREALSDAMQPIAKARLRVAVADFLYYYKFLQLYPDDFDPRDSSSQRLDASATPLLTAFNRDIAAYLRHLQFDLRNCDQRRPCDKHTQYASDGIVTISTLSTIPSGVSTSTQNEFAIPPSFALKDFLGGSVTPTAGKDQTQAQANAAKLPTFLAANLVPGVALPFNAFLNMDTAPTVASLGHGLTLTVTSYSLQGGSAAELNVNLISQDEAPPAIIRGTTSKTDTRSRVARHNLQTMVRVNSMRLFELSAFGAELRRGGESIPLIPPFIELPVIGSFARWPVAPSRIYHRSFAVASAVVLPTAADLVSAVKPTPDVLVSEAKIDVKVDAVSGPNAVTYTVIARRQDMTIIAGERERKLAGPPSATSKVSISWNGLGNDVRYDVYRKINGKTVLIAADISVPHVVDDGAADSEQTLPNSDKPIPQMFTVITPASFLAGSVPLFHKDKLECIAQEAYGKQSSKCQELKLSRYAAMAP